MSDTTPPGAPPPPASAGEGAVPRPGFLGRLRRRLVAFERWDRRLLALIVGVGGAFLLYLVIAGWWVHTIDDDPTFTAPAPVENGSQTVDMAEALILREIDTHRWTANDPFFMPGALLDNMPNYQRGIIYAVARVTAELGDHIGRARGASAIDPDLDRAAGFLRNPGDIWLFDFSVSWAPTTASEEQYRAAASALRSYNERVAAGTAVFERRADNLRLALERIATDLGSQSAALATQIANRPWLIDTMADDVFYATKGRLYGYLMLLGALGRDFDAVLEQNGARSVWEEMLQSLREAVELQPWVVANAAPDGSFQPNHLAVQGFYLLRARTQLREISSILEN